MAHWVNNGLIGNDEPENLHGSAGDNTIWGHGGTDNIWGKGGDDILIGGEGADKLDGGADIDMAKYTDSDEGVVVSLLTGKGAGGTAEGDTLTNIENLWGSWL